MSYAHRITKATFVIISFSLATALLSYFTKIYLAHNLSVESFGLFYSVLSLTSLLLLFKDFGLGPALAKYLPEFQHRKEFSRLKSSVVTSYVFQMFVGIAFFLGVWHFHPYLISDFFKTTSATPVLLTMVIEVVVASTTVKYALQGLQFIKSYALMELLRTLFVLASITVLLQRGVVGVALSYLIGSIAVQVIFSLYIVKKTRKMPGKAGFSMENLGMLSRFGIYFLLASMAGFLIAYTDTIMLTALRSLEEVGLYQVAISTSQVLWGVALALSVVLMPVLSEMWAKNEKDKVSKGVSFLLKFVMIILIPAIMLMVTFSEVVINILFGSRYLGASTSLQILSFGAIFYSLLAIYSTTLASIGRPDASTKITVFVGLFNLAANFVLVQAMGIIGAAIATSSAYFIGLALYHAYFRHLINARIKIVDITKTVAGAFLSLAVLFLLKEILYMDVLIESAITLVAALSIYAVFIVKARTLEKNDIDILKASRLPIPSAVMKVLEKNSR